MSSRTGNAAVSIAFRNSVFRVVPRAYVDEIYAAARKVAAGSAETLRGRRAEMLKFFAGFGVVERQLLDLLSVTTCDDISLDHLAVLRALATSLNEGRSVEEVFGRVDEPPGPRAGDDGPSIPEASGAPDPAITDKPSEPASRSDLATQKSAVLAEIRRVANSRFPDDGVAAQAVRLKTLAHVFGSPNPDKIGLLPLDILKAGLSYLENNPGDPA